MLEEKAIEDRRKLLLAQRQETAGSIQIKTQEIQALTVNLERLNGAIAALNEVSPPKEEEVEEGEKESE
tara:strand:+ start:79 stop:285 length:207 start_codon:yes stop_codon:yes gene_type:complete